MGHRIISTAHHDVKMQQQDFGDKIAADNYKFPGLGTGGYVPACAAKKRKLEEDDFVAAEKGPLEVDDENAYLAHRQSVFDISMGKLNRYRQFPDPSLRRSVLICNTLRTIEGEMVSEGMEVDTVAASTFLPSIQTDSITNLDPPPNEYSPYSLAALPVPDLELPCEPDYEKRLTDLDCSSGRATPYPELPRPPGGGASSAMAEWDDRGQGAVPFGCLPRPGVAYPEQKQEPEPLRPPAETNVCLSVSDWQAQQDKGRGMAISWSSVLNFSSQSDMDAANNNVADADIWSCDGETVAQSGGPNTSPSASSDSGISTASDEIFGDIDLSLYDFDLLPLSPPIAARLAPPSAEELLRAFSNQPAPP